jgi:hypothetical protein
MPALPPSLWTELYFDGAWNTITRDVRQTSQVTVTRGLSSESTSEAEPTSSELTLDSRDHKYAPRNPTSELYGKIGRNTPLRWGYYEGSPWVQSDGTGTSVLTTPSQTAFNVTDLDVRLDIALESWETQQALASRYTASGNNRSWGIYLGGTGQLALVWSADGTSTTITQFSTVPVVAYNGQRMAIRVTLDVNNGAGGYELRFYTGRTVDDEEWNLLGDPIVGASTTAVYAATSQIEFGDVSGLVLNCLTGKGYAMKLMTAIGGNTAMRMTTQDASPGVTSFSSGGYTWTKSTTGVTLTNKHVRMAGEVPSWPPVRDLSGNDTVVNLVPTDVTRRMDAGNKPIDSALLRFIKSESPIECWPLTDGKESSVAKSLVGGRDMIQRFGDTDTAYNFAQESLADWIEPVVQVLPDTTGSLFGQVPNSTSAASKWSVDLFMRGGGNESAGGFLIYDQGAGTDDDNQFSVFMVFNGNLDSLATTYTLAGETSSSVSLLTSGAGANIYDESLHHIRMTMDPGATNTSWEMYVDGTLLDSGTLSGIVVKAVRTIELRAGYLTLTGQNMTSRAFGYITYWDGNGPTAAQMWDAATGFQGERAGARIDRLATESGYTATVAGETVYQRQMGIQGRKKLLELLNEANKTNFGYLMGARDRLEVIHRGQSTLWNQPPGVTLDFSSGVISAPFRPVDDDKLTENDVSVQREFGSVPARQVLESGALSVQDFPDGVGRYDKQYTYSLYTDDQADQVAYMRLHLGTYDGVRYTRITLDLANPRVYAMIDDILRLDVGDKIRLSNVPEDHGPDDVDVLIQGYSEEVGPSSWKITFNCVPGEPWNGGITNSSIYGTVDTAGCQLNEALDETETGVDVLTTATHRWVDSATYPTDFPFDVRTGGEVMRVTACTGTTTSQTFTVTRSINGVRKSHSSGQAVELANPVYVAP